MVRYAIIQSCGECPYRVGDICRLLRDAYGYVDLIKIPDKENIYKECMLTATVEDH